MRRVTFLLIHAATAGPTGCGNNSETRPDPVEVKGTVTLPGGASPKDLTVTFQPQQNTPPAGAKVAADGSFSVNITPGKYSVYFTEEANAKVPGYKAVPAGYRSASNDNTVTVESGKPLTVEVK